MRRILIITNEYPAKLNSFISNDITSFGEKAIVDILPIYPIDDKLYKYLPSKINRLIQRGRVTIIKVHFVIYLIRFLYYLLANLEFFLEVLQILKQSWKYGKNVFFKTIYALIIGTGSISYLETNSYDFVLSYWGNYSATAAYIFSKYSKEKTKFITYLHAGTDLYRHQVYLIEKLIHAELIVTVCNFNVSFLMQLYKKEFSIIENKIVIYHLGVNIQESKNVVKTENQSRYIISVASLVPAKGIIYSIKAIEELKNRGLRVNYRIIGDGPERKALESYVNAHNLADLVFFVGLLKHDEVVLEIQDAYCLVHSSPDIGDAVPTVIKEAMISGTPVIATKIAGIPELLDNGDAGILVDPRSVLQLADNVEKLLANSNLRDDIARKGYNFAVKTFSQEKNFNELYDKIQSTIKSSSI